MWVIAAWFAKSLLVTQINSTEFSPSSQQVAEPSSVPIAAADSVAPMQRFAERQIYEVESETLIVVVPPTDGSSVLTLPPGAYAVRFADDAEDVVTEISLRPGERLALERFGLDLQATGKKNTAWGRQNLKPGRFATRGATEGKYVSRFILGASRSDISVPGIDLSSGNFALTFGLDYAITERLRWLAPLPLFSYRFGSDKSTEVIPWGGVTNVGFGYNSVDGGIFLYAMGLGTDARFHLNPQHAFTAGARVTTGGFISSTKVFPDESPNTWRTTVTGGYRLSLSSVTFNMGLSVALNPMAGGRGVRWTSSDENLDLRVSVGSVSYFGPFPQPLVSVQISSTFSIDGYVAIGIPLRNAPLLELYLVGVTMVFD